MELFFTQFAVLCYASYIFTLFDAIIKIKLFQLLLDRRTYIKGINTAGDR